MEQEDKWFAVYTKPRWEKKVAEELTKLQIESYCPLNRVVRNWSDRKKTVQVPLFTSYVFVHLHQNQVQELYKVNGILNLVNWLGKPAVIKDAEIETIKRFLNEHTNVQLEKTNVNIHDSVRITAGTLMDNQGTVVAIKNNTVRMALPSLGYTLYAEISKESIAKMPASLTA
ncbi:UpxY family transcription antiterminator [Pontibacter fetidus]|uniref:UpxY family transcription antiterminator n=1 Tax=Pontibacter fetidus TaxID=2700082 RepID=A0A6B2H0D9_9BACT|nr:UpxY family transcription antiterminator [Pontibacter fetidus]NDK55588.1 UpxY family transcription antiterminator [Pontibacter fetidus]